MSDTGTSALSVIAPCLNEELNVPRLVERMMPVFDELAMDCELVLVDDGSSDGTWTAIEAAMAQEPKRVKGVRHPVNRGIVAGWKSGLEVSRGSLVCLIDSDLQNRPEDILKLHEARATNAADVAQAVRHPTGSRRRMVFSRALNHVLNVAFGMNLRDNKSGFILCRRDALLEALADADGYRYFQSFLGVALGARGHRFAEVDTQFEARQAGESFLSNFPIMVSLNICRELFRYRMSLRKRGRD